MFRPVQHRLSGLRLPSAQDAPRRHPDGVGIPVPLLAHDGVEPAAARPPVVVDCERVAFSSPRSASTATGEPLKRLSTYTALSRSNLLGDDAHRIATASER